MRQLLLSRDSGISSYGPEIIDHCLLLANIKSSMKVIDFLNNEYNENNEKNDIKDNKNDGKNNDKINTINDSNNNNENVLINCGKILNEIKNAESLLISLDIPGQPGYILYRNIIVNKNEEDKKDVSTDKNNISDKDENINENENNKKDNKENNELIENKEFYDFVPRIFKQHEGMLFIACSSFDETVDEYFCKVRKKIEK